MQHRHRTLHITAPTSTSRKAEMGDSHDALVPATSAGRLPACSFVAVGILA
jgi:hypothetical protein